MSMVLVSLGTMLLFVNPAVVELSICRTDRGPCQLILIRIRRREGVILAVTKRSISSNSGAEDLTNLIIWGKLRSGPFLVGMGASSEINIWSPV